MRRTVVLLVLTAAVLVGGACGSDDTTDTAAGAPTTTASTVAAGSVAAEPVVKDVLAEMVDPPGGTGSTLTLIRYTIAPGAQLSPHIHPGVQLASIESGTLTYTVESGTAVVHRADGTEEPVTGPAVTTLGPGDAVQETGDMLHFGANDTAEPVVILATLLTENGKDLAIVEQPAPDAG